MSSLRIPKLAVAVTFHFLEHRLQYLQRIASQYPLLADETIVTIVTNAGDPQRQAAIRAAMPAGLAQLNLAVPALLGHPHLLTWCHQSVFREQIAADPSITHFMYVEDDILVTPDNVQYWLQGREVLREGGMIPSFLRYEERDDCPLLYSTDVPQRVQFDQLPRVDVREGYSYLNLPQPYQAMYLLDRELMVEHLEGRSCEPDFIYGWGIRERAASGLTFARIPPGASSRNFVGFDADKWEIDPAALIHHTPNNYASNPESAFGKIPVTDLIL